MAGFETTVSVSTPERRGAASPGPGLDEGTRASARSSAPARVSGRASGRPVRRKRKQTRSRNAYLGLGGALGSARDRQRLRDRNAAERARVERMLADVPAPGLSVAKAPARRPEPGLRSLAALPVSGCPVCASAKVVSDEVSHGGTLRLSECLHCEHRWTERTRDRWAELGATMSHATRRRRVQSLSAARPLDPQKSGARVG